MIFIHCFHGFFVFQLIQSANKIELMINKLHGLSPSGGSVSPHGGFASLLFDQVEYFASIKLCQALSRQGAIIKTPVVRCHYLVSQFSFDWSVFFQAENWKNKTNESYWKWKVKKNEEKLKIFCQRYFLLLTKTRPKEKRPERFTSQAYIWFQAWIFNVNNKYVRFLDLFFVFETS